MAHEIAKFRLAQADAFLDRIEAVEAALSCGMSLHEIEEALDWLDASRPRRREKPGEAVPNPDEIERPAAG